MTDLDDMLKGKGAPLPLSELANIAASDATPSLAIPCDCVHTGANLWNHDHNFQRSASIPSLCRVCSHCGPQECCADQITHAAASIDA